MTHRCRICRTPLRETFVDLGMAPPCEAFLPAEADERSEVFHPLRVRVCHECLLVQLPEYLSAQEIFTDAYPYFSSFSTSWLEHARDFAEDTTRRLGLGADSLVTEVASNDGYLLRHFAELGVPVLGVEPTGNTAQAARELGIRTEGVFLGEETGARLAREHGRADLVVGNNVYAHVPDLADFTAGLRELLAPDGLLSLEFPHLARLIEQRQLDTIYHEHFQYYTLLSAQRALALGDLEVVDVEELATHGGSLRVLARHRAYVEQQGIEPTPAVDRLLADERAAGLHEIGGYTGFAASAQAVKRDLLEFLLDAQRRGASVVGYGAPGKGNTMLNYAGIRADLLPFTVDRNFHKHGMYLPGSHIPVRPVEALEQARPDYVLVLPWNLRTEIAAQLEYVAGWGGRLVFALPQLEIVEPGGGVR